VDTEQFDPVSWDVVVVSHNNVSDLADYWLQRDYPEWMHIVVVENGFARWPLWSERPGVTVVRTANRGLAAANNLGAAQGSAPYVLFCNPDVRLEIDDLPRLQKHLHELGGLVAPRLVSENGTSQGNGRSFPTPVAQLANRLPVDRGRLGRLKHDYAAPRLDGEVAEVDWLVGACIAMSRADLDALGGWDERYFLYFEDTDLCLRARRAGMGVAVLTPLTWTHSWASSSRRWFSRAWRRHVRSAVAFYWRNPELLHGHGAGPPDGGSDVCEPADCRAR
jgi:N-acetylglucosaminyl-diphospho-decaprenol L-rhamnosyltransferase